MGTNTGSTDKPKDRPGDRSTANTTEGESKLASDRSNARTLVKSVVVYSLDDPLRRVQLIRPDRGLLQRQRRRRLRESRRG